MTTHWIQGRAFFPESSALVPSQQLKTKLPASAGTLAERGRNRPSVQVLALQIISTIKLPPNQKRQWMTGKKVKGSWRGTHTMHSVTLLLAP